MLRRWTTGLSILASGGLAAACASLPPEEMTLRAPSPDGRMEAVLMVCHAPRAITSIWAVGAVFVLQEGRTFGCDDVSAGAKAWFTATLPGSPPASRPETIEWVDGRAVFTLRRRIVIWAQNDPDAPDLLERRVLEPPVVD